MKWFLRLVRLLYSSRVISQSNRKLSRLENLVLKNQSRRSSTLFYLFKLRLSTTACNLFPTLFILINFVIDFLISIKFKN